ncbi:MAG: SpoIIE family protein phosphatase [Clostridium sp.]
MDVNKLRTYSVIQELFRIGTQGEISPAIHMMLSAMDEMVFEKGQEIVAYGADAADGMYILLEGSVEVFDREGKLINEGGAGDIIGELALIRGCTREATVRAVTRVEGAHISRLLFEKMTAIDKSIYGEMMAMIYHKTTSLVRERERMKAELQIAARIQTGMLPKNFTSFQNLPHVKIGALMQPAKEVGGDFYDVFMSAPGRLCMVMADVSGKGVPAALFMMMAKTHIRNYGMLGMELEELAKQVNNRLCTDNEEELFVTAFIGVLDLESNRFSFINAGHNRPYLYLKDQEYTQLECHSDFVLGMMEGMRYHEQWVQLPPESRLFLYTDGAVEAVDREDELYSDERLKASLDSLRDVIDPQLLCHNILDKLERFSEGEPMADDITLLSLFR